MPVRATRVVPKRTGWGVEAPQSRLRWRGVCLPSRAITQNANYVPAVGFLYVAMLQTSSNHAVFQGGLALIVTNVVNPRPKSAFSGVFACRLTTFVTCGVGDALKMLRIDDVCNNSRARRPFEGFLWVLSGDVEYPQSRSRWRGVCLPPWAITQNANHAPAEPPIMTSTIGRRCRRPRLPGERRCRSRSTGTRP